MVREGFAYVFERMFEASSDDDALVTRGIIGGERVPTRAPNSNMYWRNQTAKSAWGVDTPFVTVGLGEGEVPSIYL